jgi:DNA-binding LacI/PurR family transcriptional regulator
MTEKTNRRAKLKDVAKAAGVSQGTASNAFNRPELVRPLVRERVEKAARELGYFGPDPKARLLRVGKVNAIGVVTGQWAPLAELFRHPYPRAFLSGVAEVCDEKGSGLALVSGVGDTKAWGISNAIVDGFIIHTEEEIAEKVVEIAKRRRLPFVLIDTEAGPDANWVRLDDRSGAREAARHLVGLGHRRFAILSVLRARGRETIFHDPGTHHHRLAAGFIHDSERIAGYAEAFTEAGISIDDMPIIEAPASTVGAASGALTLFDRAPGATAVLTSSDTQALAVLAEARRRNISVPGDLSVVGFDDQPEAALADPPLTTVFQPVVEKGRAAARILFEGGPPRHIVLPLQLIVRASTAPPPS